MVLLQLTVTAKLGLMGFVKKNNGYCLIIHFYAGRLLKGKPIDFLQLLGLLIDYAAAA
jgi:hypothetical protein